MCIASYIIEHTQKSDSAAILSLDAEKAFDRLEWDYLWSVLHYMGFDTQFISMIKILYTNPMAMVLTGNTFSKPFKIAHGSRQGCPLSPFLFVLSLEDAAQSVPHLNLFNVFSSVSGYKVNWRKSALPLLYVTERILSSLNIPVVKKIKYLGVDIYPSITDIIKNNYDRIARDTEADPQRWDSLLLSFAARISTIKMTILPWISFISSIIPLSPIKGYWEKLHLSISKSIWVISTSTGLRNQKVREVLEFQF